MSNWLHRNPLKSTTSITFDLPMSVAKANSVEICSNLKKLRLELLDRFQDARSNVDLVEKAFNSYLSFLLGLIDDSQNLGQNDPRTKLRHSVKFKWTQSLLGNVPLVYQDSVFELISICQEMAIWLMKHASALTANANVSEEDAKSIFKSLRKASGLFKFAQVNYFAKLEKEPVKGSDLDPRVSNAYHLQCLAEAQEVTIARAIEMKHSPSLIAGLCIETSRQFATASVSIKDLDQEKVGKFYKYLCLKSSFYEAYAYCYNGMDLLDKEKSGEAIKSLQECEQHIELLRKLCKDYAKAKGFGVSSRLDQHPVFYRLLTIAKRIKEKCETENVMLYHQKVPIENITLSSKATHGVTTPEEFEPPALNPLWSYEAYRAFGFEGLPPAVFSPKDAKKEKSSKEAKPLPDFKEKDIGTAANQANKTESACVLQ